MLNRKKNNMRKLISLTLLAASLMSVVNASSNTNGVYLKASVLPFASLEIMELHVDQEPLQGDVGIRFL